MLADLQGLIRSLIVYYGHPLRHRRLVRLYAPFVRPGDLVVDGGAHAGNHVRAFLALRARVLAVEPHPAFASLLRRVFSREPGVIVIEAGLGAESGRADLHISRRTPTVSTLAPGWRAEIGKAHGFAGVRWERHVSVRVLRLDDLLAEHGRPAFIKLDVEGHEPEALAGLSAQVPALSFEVLPAGRARGAACIERLEALGSWDYSWTIGERAALQPDWVGREAILARIASLAADGREINIFARRRDP